MQGQQPLPRRPKVTEAIPEVRSQCDAGSHAPWFTGLGPWTMRLHLSLNLANPKLMRKALLILSMVVDL
jgi:hypothetical protein